MIPENSNEEIAALKNQVFTLLIALIVISGTLTVFLYRQASVAVYVNGRLFGARWSTPPLWRTAVPIAMNSAQLGPSV